MIYESDITDEKLVALYSNAEKLLFPSHGEGFGRPMLESLACGTPVVAYDKRPMSEILPEDMLVDEDVEFMKKAVESKFEDEVCRGIAQKYTWNKTAEKTIMTYRKLE
ncbi:MAG: hypothetical protein BRC26_01980 [Nanohaloarchaea archaeon QH_8_44_6]|nr:MAG: hypothetical protein BRC26_01980 [Nanohaloarchaea archaeon QH_8_44_6]